MMNIAQETEWDYSFWAKKFGVPVTLPAGDDWNPKITKVYYFKSINMSIIVNVLKGEIAVWRQGKQTN